MPFNILFQKNLRKRQTDLFLDSWRKITAKLNLPHQFKCKTRAQFFNLFMDAFQNCIEEIGNKSDMDESANQSTSLLQTTQASSATLDFKNKMIKSFEQCQLWPLNVEEYKQFFENAKKRVDELEAANKEDPEHQTQRMDIPDQEVTDSSDSSDSEEEADPDVDDEENLENKPPNRKRSEDEEYQPKKRARLSINSVSTTTTGSLAKQQSRRNSLAITASSRVISTGRKKSMAANTPVVSVAPSTDEVTTEVNTVEESIADEALQSTELNATLNTPMQTTKRRKRPDTPSMSNAKFYVAKCERICTIIIIP